MYVCNFVFLQRTKSHKLIVMHYITIFIILITTLQKIQLPSSFPSCPHTCMDTLIITHVMLPLSLPGSPYPCTVTIIIAYSYHHPCLITLILVWLPSSLPG